MKHFFKLLIVAAFVLPMVNASAQTKADSSKKTNSPSMQSESYVTIKDGKAWQYQNGTLGNLTETFTCSNGDKVSADGTITKADGSTAQLNEGDKIFKDGHVAKSPK